ncbi:zinc finger protein 16-like [Gigantopelta aegis]|uniref:zinc finger protein 16-like n=1 Tax=Gigantopelta aegis TaxID=1735272 RepID=UPI001B88900C|nr:zinc finger protein 16-like [Gigantopelta aegis]
MPWLPIFMKSFQEYTESLPRGLEIGSSCSLANSIMREEISCKSCDITSSDCIHDQRTSPLNTAFQNSFSDILANCLSHISLGLDIKHSSKDSVPTILRNETGMSHSVPTILRNETGMSHSVPTILRNETGMSHSVPTILRNETGMSHSVPTILRNETGMSHSVPTILRNETRMCPIFHHSNEKPSASCESKVNRCYICYKILRSSRSLLTHLQRHVTLPSFTCTECGKSFYKSSDLKKHKHIHKDSKPYVCDFCCSCFNQKSNMIRHRKLHLRRKIQEILANDFTQ